LIYGLQKNGLDNPLDWIKTYFDRKVGKSTVKQPMKTILKIIIAALICISFSAHAQMQTLTATSSNILSSVITICTNQYAIVKSADYDDGGLLLINMQGVSFSKNFSFESVDGLTISGPATIQLEAEPNAYYSTYATIEVKPQQLPVPPNQAVTVGSNAGNVQVTMITSTDLVNWTPAVNGMVYTNSPAARFFRIQLLTNVQSP
jgi:hypothetical protein